MEIETEFCDLNRRRYALSALYETHNYPPRPKIIKCVCYESRKGMEDESS